MILRDKKLQIKLLPSLSRMKDYIYFGFAVRTVPAKLFSLWTAHTFLYGLPTQWPS